MSKKIKRKKPKSDFDRAIQGLVAMGFMIQINQGQYTLTPKGKRYVERMNNRDGRS